MSRAFEISKLRMDTPLPRKTGGSLISRYRRKGVNEEIVFPLNYIQHAERIPVQEFSVNFFHQPPTHPHPLLHRTRVFVSPQGCIWDKICNRGFKHSLSWVKCLHPFTASSSLEHVDITTSHNYTVMSIICIRFSPNPWHFRRDILNDRFLQGWRSVLVILFILKNMVVCIYIYFFIFFCEYFEMNFQR